MVKKFLKDENGDIIVKNGNPLRVNITSEEEFHNLKVNKISLDQKNDTSGSNFYQYNVVNSYFDNKTICSVKILSDALTDKDLENIKNGKLFLCLNYPLRSSSRHSEENYGFSTNPRGNLYTNGLIQITEDDIITKNYGKQYISKSIPMDELLLRMVKTSKSKYCNSISDNLTTDEYNFNRDYLKNLEESINFNYHIKNEVLNPLDVATEFFQRTYDATDLNNKAKLQIAEGFFAELEFTDITWVPFNPKECIVQKNQKEGLKYYPIGLNNRIKTRNTSVKNVAFINLETNSGNSKIYNLSNLYSYNNEKSNISYITDDSLSQMRDRLYPRKVYLPYVNLNSEYAQHLHSRMCRNLNVKFNFVVKDNNANIIEFKGDKFYKGININYRFYYLISQISDEFDFGCIEYVANYL